MITLDEKKRAATLTDSYLHGIFDLISPMKQSKLHKELLYFKARLAEEIEFEEALIQAEKGFK